jgi:ABC-type bacteriocin/lantibiotic exporter with double-glycine peptidase domain
MSSPQEYDIMLGENASPISGGQARRLQIVRALARPAKVLILDECTSALDPANQAAVLDTVRGAKLGCMTLMVMHMVPIMRMCDRIVLIQAEPNRYNTTDVRLQLVAGVVLGENVSLISGGPVQRLQIVRALARLAKVLILDECTSALDRSNQAAVLDKVKCARLGRTT